MELNWLQSLLYGMISGFAEFLPISAEAHRGLLRLLMGAENHSLLELTVRGCALLALLLNCWPQLSKLQRERRIATLPVRRRKRQPDPKSLKDLRFMKTACVPMTIGLVLILLFNKTAPKLWVTALILLINGVLLYLPPYFSGGNRDSQTVSALDAVLIGVGSAFAAFPGMSRITGMTVVGQLRRCDRSYILDVALLLSIPALVVHMLFDLFAVFAAGAAISGGLILSCLLAGMTAFIGAYLGITFIRFLAVKVGFSGFAYYSWGAALFAFILYLTI